MKHFRKLNVQMEAEINPQKRKILAYAAVETESIWLKRATLTVSKFVLRSFVNLVHFRLHTKKLLWGSRFWKIWFSQYRGKQKVATTTNKDFITVKLYRA